EVEDGSGRRRRRWEGGRPSARGGEVSDGEPLRVGDGPVCGERAPDGQGGLDEERRGLANAAVGALARGREDDAAGVADHAVDGVEGGGDPVLGGAEDGREGATAGVGAERVLGGDRRDRAFGETDEA